MNGFSRRRFLALLAAGATGPPANASAQDVRDILSLDYIDRQRARLDASDVVKGTVQELLPDATILWVVPPNLLLSSGARFTTPRRRRYGVSRAFSATRSGA